MMSTSTHSKVVVLTGSIGTGKSTVADLLKQLGATIVSADELARQAVAKGSKGLTEITKHFGPDILKDDGQLDRSKLGRLIFADPKKRQELEQITHPIIAQLAVQRFEEQLELGARLLVYECPLFFEAGLDSLGFRSIVVVTADKETAKSRIVSRDGLSPEEAEQRISSQLPVTEKANKADYLIDNSGTLASLKTQVEELFEQLVQ